MTRVFLRSHIFVTSRYQSAPDFGVNLAKYMKKYQVFSPLWSKGRLKNVWKLEPLGLSTLCERPWPARWNRCQFRHPEMTKFTLCPSEATPELWHSRTLPGEVTRHSHKLGTTRYLQDQFCGLFKVPESKTKKQHDGRCLINTLVKALTL